MIGYLYATSIVGLDKFDAHWTREFRAQFEAPPSEWLQRDPKNMPLPSWSVGRNRSIAGPGKRPLPELAMY